MKLLTTGQFGNWMFHYFSAIRQYGDSVDGMISQGCSRAEHDRSLALFSQLLPHVNVQHRTAVTYWETQKAVKHCFKSNWQSLSVIPDREWCREHVKSYTSQAPDYDYVIHVRGGDYFSYFKAHGDRISYTRDTILRAIEGIGTTPDHVVAVTDDVRFVRGTGIQFQSIQNGKMADDWDTLYAAHNLLMSPSTFSFWAGFLGEHERCLMPLGIGPWDCGVLDGDPYSAHHNKDLCWGDECLTINVL